jgi:hypothetical protein
VPKLSIVLPVLGQFAPFEETLLSVLENRPGHCEIVAVLNGPYDDPYRLADEVRFVTARNGADWIESANAGIEQSRSPFIALLTCGVRVTQRWAGAALRQFGDPQVASVTPLVLDAGDPGQVVAAGVGYDPQGRPWIIGQGQKVDALGESVRQTMGPSLLAGFYRRKALTMLGDGFEPRVGLHGAAADVAMQFQRLGFHTVFEPSSRMLAAGLTLAPRASLKSGREAERLFLRNLSASWAGSLVNHAGMVVREVCSGFPGPAALMRLTGRVLAWMELPRSRRHRRRLDEMRRQLLAPPVRSMEPVRLRSHSSRAA